MAAVPKSGGIDRLFKQILVWIQSLVGHKKQKYQPPKILKEHSSTLTRLLLLERDTPRAIRTWRSIPKKSDHDILITCDHLNQVRGEKPIEKQNPQSTHRLTIVKLSRIPGPNGSRKIVPLWSADYNWIDSRSGMADMNRYAVVITDALAKQLLGSPDEEIDWAWEVQQYTKQYVGNTASTVSPLIENQPPRTA